jgi:ribonuclease BN (tRNA processing enzyme)
MRHAVVVLALAPSLLLLGYAQAPAPSPVRTQVVLLGTGTPRPNPQRFGPSTAVVAGDQAYLFDAGIGVTRRLASAREKGIEALAPTKVRRVFLTHLHSDHTLGLPDIILTPWVMGRTEPLELWGPHGTRAMVDHILAAYAQDIDIRTHKLEHANTTGYKVNVHEIDSGDIYKDANVTITPFLVRHGEWKQAFGYRIEAPGRTIVISGDTSKAESIVENCHGCDILIHEVYTQKSYDLVAEPWQTYRRAYHTSTRELGDIATRAKPGLLIIYHPSNAGCDQSGIHNCMQAESEEQTLQELKQFYGGNVVMGHDLDVF